MEANGNRKGANHVTNTLLVVPLENTGVLYSYLMMVSVHTIDLLQAE